MRAFRAAARIGTPRSFARQQRLAQDDKWQQWRGVSSTVKLPVSKTGLGGSNPSAPASTKF
jgi:hypothetical protein